jgi:hypothetical protein
MFVQVYYSYALTTTCTATCQGFDLAMALELVTQGLAECTRSFAMNNAHKGQVCSICVINIAVNAFDGFGCAHPTYIYLDGHVGR